MAGVDVRAGVVCRAGGGELGAGFVVRMFVEIDMPFLFCNLFLAADFRGLTQICVNPRSSAAKYSVPPQGTNAARLSIFALDGVADHC